MTPLQLLRIAYSAAEIERYLSSNPSLEHADKLIDELFIRRLRALSDECILKAAQNVKT